VTNWVEVYRPLIGAKLEALIWMPMTSDTPDLVRDRRSPAFTFSGGVFLEFAERKLFLSWRQVGLDHLLGEGPEVAWLPHALDRVRVLSDGPWAGIEGATLVGVEFFIGQAIDDDAPVPTGQVMGIRHTMRRDDGTDTHFWIGTGGMDYVGSSDDLWVGVGIDPTNRAELALVGNIAP
jgi:hypothetical protein